MNSGKEGMNHLVEWRKSCVDEELTRLNVIPLEGDHPLNYLLYADGLPRRNDGRITNELLKRYQHTAQGGWWCSGIDVLTGEDDLWGCFKPNSPRLNADRQKTIKYEHPPQTPTGLFALRVPLHLWQRIAELHGGGETITQNGQESQDPSSFWQWLINNPQIPLCITEGVKKAGALLSAGYAAIALPGVYNGYRTPKDEQGNPIGKSYLIPQLKKLATGGRKIYIVFDQDTKPNTIKTVNQAIRKLGYLLTQAGCQVKIITWNPQQGKGVDDLIANCGREAFVKAYEKALPLNLWKAQWLTRLTYGAKLEVNSRYLENISPPEEAKLIAIKSPKGTGKTKFLEQIVANALARKQWVLVIGHRVRLVEELCQRFGLKYITEVRDNPQGQIFGYGLCIDSLHPNSQAQFKADNWADGVVIIDEVEQVLWHGLNSDTCKSNRVEILKSLKTLMQNLLGGQGKVYVADADLSDLSLNYLISLSGVNIQPWIIHNTWHCPQELAWEVYHYEDTTPKRLLRDLVKHIHEGGKPFVCLSAQKLSSKWGTITLEAYLQKEFPHAKILRIDSESLADSTHRAYQCITHLNEILGNYDIVLASPSIETGVSIDLKQHFTSVWCLAQGVQTPTSVCQALARIRANIPRYLWAANYGFNQVGNGATSLSSLLTSGNRLTQLNIRLLQQSDFDSLDEIDTNFQAESLLCWAKMAVRVNAYMLNYRESILQLLREDNHQILSPSQGKITGNINDVNYLTIEGNNSDIHNQLTQAIETVRELNYQCECNAIALADDLNEKEYATIKKRLLKIPKERQALRKYELRRRYCIPVTPQLVIKDDQGWYEKLRLHYFLTVGRCYLADRDAMIAKRLLSLGYGSLFMPDFNSSQLGAIVGTMEVFGIPVLLANVKRELRNTDEDLIAMAQLALNNRSEVKSIMGIGLAKNSSPIVIIRRFLDKIGYGLTCIRCDTIGKKRVRVYQLFPPNDGREEVFKQWLMADGKYPGSSELWTEDSVLLRCRSQIHENVPDKYIQLSLEL